MQPHAQGSQGPDALARGMRFQALHRAAGLFVIPNPWDAGSARVLATLGYQALATSSSSLAGTLGRADGAIGRDQMLAMVRPIVDATPLPVSADLEAGFGDTPEQVAHTIRLAAAVGLAGGSVEDAMDHGAAPLSISEAVERIQAAAEAAHALPAPFTLTARAENFLRGKPDLDDTIRRLQAYERAGADVLFAPALPDLAAVREVCAALTKPLSFMAGIPGKSFSIAELQAAGVRRVSLASSLYRTALQALVGAAQEVLDTGTFKYLDRALPSARLGPLMSGIPPASKP
ncbi:MAG: isocitrate lyase/phosphoenolpyruvate mutase family protein [Burkholderiaceae bacterium]|uniref:isocitrate lyase/PEP mutase family protein n=1 Tax=Hydrogenophaga sp. TaxID=1904254 RepID=UPI00271E609D|nr:isocitrate lyase/phosphoenolpyruvate mutase family protein [Hydrogenophaga sp.]MDO8277886.1 isocitrate lyase/phosphoenolpyruvate mutase family protein [Burkholderiaceae bacterium]MDO9031030.1 isocitrate lyase/phosphoenolpyruvate mutase family protein [Hydrogenophaga sp.]